MPVPIVTFNRYTKDGSIVDISSDVYTITAGSYDGIAVDKYVYSIVVDPMEATTTTVAEHEFVFDMDINGDTEGSYFAPFSHAGSQVFNHAGDVDHARYGGVTADVVDISTWTVGLTSGVVNIKADAGFVGDGTPNHFVDADFPQAGSSWSATFGASGSAVLDVPTIYNGSYVAHVNPLTWDKADRLHDWQQYQLHVGHVVELSDVVAIISGTMENNQIDLYASGSTNVFINIKTYHEMPQAWEFWSGATLMQSGTQSFVQDTWLFINSLDFGTVVGDTAWQLKLYASGTIAYPTPLRTISINIYVLEGRGRFGVGRFGLARFGLESDD